jgi:hypothetical protein
MSTLSPRMGLKRPDDSDPFLSQDFVDNWNKIDAAPGVHICTSGTRPSWGSAQAGRTVFLTDYKAFQWWDGSAWQNERAATGLFAGGAVFDATLSKNAVVTYNLVNFTTPRPCSLAIAMSMTVSCDARFVQDVYGRIVYDGGDILLGAYSDAMRFAGKSDDTSADTKNTMTMLGVVNVSAGAHTLGGKVTVGTHNTSVILRGMKTISVLGVYASNQIL